MWLTWQLLSGSLPGGRPVICPYTWVAEPPFAAARLVREGGQQRPSVHCPPHSRTRGHLRLGRVPGAHASPQLLCRCQRPSVHQRSQRGPMRVPPQPKKQRRKLGPPPGPPPLGLYLSRAANLSPCWAAQCGPGRGTRGSGYTCPLHYRSLPPLAASKNKSELLPPQAPMPPALSQARPPTSSPAPSRLRARALPAAGQQFLTANPSDSHDLISDSHDLISDSHDLISDSRDLTSDSHDLKIGRAHV